MSSVRDDPRAQLTRGLRLAEAGDVAGAIDAHEAALARDPSLAQAHANLISLYGRAGEWAKAEQHYKAVIALGYNVDEAHYNYGVLLGSQQRWSEAAAAYRLALAANPLHAQARNNLGQLLEGDRKLDEALDQYRQAVAANPQFRLARYNLGRMLLAARRFDDAIAEFEQLREPQDAEAPRYGTAWPWHTCRPAGGTRGWRWRARRGVSRRRSASTSCRPRSSATWRASNEADRQLLAAASLAAFAAAQNRDDRPIFDEVAARVGLTFVYRNGASNQFYIPEVMGAGAALVDYDNDGDLDVFCAGPRSTRTRRAILPARIACFATSSSRAETLRFTDVTAGSGLGGTSYGMGVATGDYDNDGDQDLYVTAFGPNTLYRNNGDGTFSDVTAAAGVSDDRWSTARDIRRLRSRW